MNKSLVSIFLMMLSCLFALAGMVFLVLFCVYPDDEKWAIYVGLLLIFLNMVCSNAYNSMYDNDDNDDNWN